MASRQSQQRVVTLALRVLDDAAYRSRTHKVDTPEVRLALAALWVVMKDRAGLEQYWQRAQMGETKPWDSCRHPYYVIAAALRAEGWHAPPDASGNDPL